MKGTDLTNQEKLEEIYEMTRENHDVLLGIRRQQYVANAFRFLYWVVILVSLGGAYYYIRPFIESVNENRIKVDETLSQFNQLRAQLPETKLLEQIMQGIKNATGGSSTAAE